MTVVGNLERHTITMKHFDHVNTCNIVDVHAATFFLQNDVDIVCEIPRVVPPPQMADYKEMDDYSINVAR
jgi:hypothetical protein